MASALAAPAAAPAATASAAPSSTHQHQHHHHAPAVPSTSSVLRRVIPWDTYVAAKLLDPGTDAASLRAADKLFATRRAVAAAAENGAPSSSSAPHDAAPPVSPSSSPEELSAAAALLSVLRGVTKEETVQYVLAVLDAEVAGSPRRARELFDRRGSGEGAEGASSSSSSSSSPDAADLFLLALSRPDWFSVERAASLLAARFGAAAAAGGREASPASSSSEAAELRQRGLFLDWILAQLQRPAHAARGVPAAAGALSKLLRGREARSSAAAAGALGLLVPLVQRLTSRGSAPSPASPASASSASAPFVPATPQLAYDLCISLWQLALTPQGAEAAVAAGAVPALTDVLRAAVAAKEKVVRAAAQALRALLSAPAGGAGAGAEGGAASAAPSTSSAPSSSSSSSSSASAPQASGSASAIAAGAAAVHCGLARVCDALLAQQWDDPDVGAALRACREASAAAARRAASWPAYRAEVLGGRLAWGPAHDGGGGGGEDGAGFWQRNAARLEERDAEVLRSLARLLAAPSSDAQTLAVACSDLARYVDASASPERARALLASLGANAHATRLLAHGDAEVRRHALAAVQRIVLSRDKLQYLNS